MAGSWGFAHAETFQQLAATQALEFSLGGRRQGGRTADTGTDRTQGNLARLNIGVVVDGVIERGDTVKERRLVFINRADHVINIPRIDDQNDLRANGNRHAEDGHHPKNVKHRNRAQKNLVITGTKHSRHLQGVGNKRPVSRHRGFRNAGGAARVLKQSQIVLRDCDIGFAPCVFRQQVLKPVVTFRQIFDPVAFLFLLRYRKQEFAYAGKILLHIGDNDGFGFGFRLNTFNQFVKQAERDNKLRVTIVNLKLQLFCRVGGVRRGDHTARF